MRLIKFCGTSALVLSAAACSALDVSDPTAIEELDVETAQGAELLRRDAVRKLYLAVSEGMIRTGLLSDELTGSAFPIPESVDRRNSLEYEELLATEGTGSIYFRWQAVRHAATVAIPVLRTSGAPGAETAHTGEMFAVRGFATLAMAETFCPGFPLHDIVDNKAMFGAPVSTDQALQSVLADLDSAAAYSADSTRILDFARIGRARALLGLGRFAEAGSAVGAVPTAYSWVAEFNSGSSPAQSNRLGLFAEPFRAKSISVGEREGGNGLDFITANDARVETVELSDCCGNTGIFPAKYPNRGAPIIWASGIEARLIEAEAALRAGQPQWLTILNELRTNGQVAGLAPLDDPGSDAARVDLLFRERAFWLFATNHRLGDLRRLIRHYGRNAETVFPTGTRATGGVYGTGTSIPFPAALETPFNPAVTGCTER